MKLKADKSFLNLKGKMIKRGDPYDSETDEEGETLVKTKLAHQVYETKVVVANIQEIPKIVKPEIVEPKIEIKEKPVEEIKPVSEESFLSEKIEKIEKISPKKVQQRKKKQNWE